MKRHSIIISIAMFAFALVACQSHDNEQPYEKPLSLAGKQMVAMGNSITSPSNSWAWVTARHFDMELTNLAVPSACWADYPYTAVDTNPDPRYNGNNTNNVISNQVFRFLQMVVPEGTVIPEAEGKPFHSETPSPLTGRKSADSTFDPFLVIISCGTNDSGSGTIGDISELEKPYDEANRETLYGAINWAVSVIRKYCPSSQIVLLTPIQRSPLPPRLPLFVEAIQLAGEKLGCPTIDMYNESGITEAEEALAHKYLYDGLHPTEEGSILMGNTVIRHLEILYGISQ
ncbi:SGNH/GDSL hydrolase family protein [Barnesiella sp. An55]|uniref:SGNH/GDSL hydrolase family protein n=1 Tax=Barnesiella sp. An55 TaxID=1965646 RepID=UPI000B38F6AF|nr:SGNH/GDSL hydrolase family protein [Barnesiella sp. An55]OUN72597.1 hypothetical protein B5G10_06840 [Barnesiella sp. An55]